jgi:hypothetical protein
VRLLVLTLLLCWPRLAMTQQIVLPTGTLTLPPGFIHQTQRGTDSYPGLIVAQDSSLLIHYDIGPMAGARVHPSRRSDFLWLIEHEVNGYQAYSGLFLRDGNRQVATTVLGQGSDPLALPANFEATIRGERELAAFMLIVTSYRPRSKR